MTIVIVCIVHVKTKHVVREVKHDKSKNERLIQTLEEEDGIDNYVFQIQPLKFQNRETACIP